MIFNGINLSKINHAIPLNKNIFFNDNEAVIILQVARFYEPKDHSTLINALSILPTKFKLLLVGEGILKEKNEELVKELKLTERVRFLGARMDIPSLLKTSDIVVLSSKYEGLSLSCVEGMASGRPFIATDAPGLNAIVKNAGVLFPIGDYKTLANIIIELDSNAVYYNQIVESGIHRAIDYDVEVMVKKIIELYNDTIR